MVPQNHWAPENTAQRERESTKGKTGGPLAEREAAKGKDKAGRRSSDREREGENTEIAAESAREKGRGEIHCRRKWQRERRKVENSSARRAKTSRHQDPLQEPKRVEDNWRSHKTERRNQGSWSENQRG
ncbi:octapeptide-repeat protein T2-like [Ambystoma mexicanum]|uniref:octapeptide-repeat protein T2-like n=1 Tax=Ambystoma mexicanum TaxID=8296 RepID=UPI0037E84938